MRQGYAMAETLKHLVCLADSSSQAQRCHGHTYSEMDKAGKLMGFPLWRRKRQFSTCSRLPVHQFGAIPNQY